MDDSLSVAPVGRAVNLGATMASAQSLTVDPLIPLKLLETVRAADRPQGSEATEAEYVPELLNKRLGMTDTVLAQIRRYHEAVERGQGVGRDEVVSLARLIGRRPDAPQLFETVGESIAPLAYRQQSSRLFRVLVRLLPKFVARPVARRKARKIEARYFSPRLTRDFGAHLAVAYHDAGMQALAQLLPLG